MSALVLTAPLNGWLSALGEAPDPVFADKMMGDGVLIDPVDGVLRAPCAGEVASLPDTRHAVTLRADNGAEILMHVGLETVALKGEGFTAHVREGERVAAGDHLLSFDLDLLARRAASLQTPVIVVNGEAFRIASRADAGAVNADKTIMTIEAANGAAAVVGAVDEDAPEAEQVVRAPLEHGVHARPAARLAEVAKTFNAQVYLEKDGKRASLRSPVAMMTLGVKLGDELRIHAQGPQAEEAVAAIAAAIASGLGEKAVPVSTAEEAAVPVKDAIQPVALDGFTILGGVTAAPGLVIGPAAPVALDEIVIAERAQSVPAEKEALADAVHKTKASLKAAAARGGRRQQDILAAHLALIDDEALRDAAITLIEEGKSAAFAWRKAVETQIRALEALDDALLAERADDLADLERQVISNLLGESPEHQNMDGAIVITRELFPSHFIRLADAGAAGFSLTGGGPTSHVAILAGERGLPMLVATAKAALTVPRDTSIVLDADGRGLHVAPGADAVQTYRDAIRLKKKNLEEAQKAALEICVTRDGTRIEVFANLGGGGDAADAVRQGAEGCGLLRTEFFYLDRQTPPSEDEQRAAYQALADDLDGRPLVIRTFDIGGDKPAPFITMPAEENPALGVRGVRLALQRPDLLKTQLRAILSVKAKTAIHIMLPMVASVSEIGEVRRILAAEADALGATKLPQLGVMIETPASAVMADVLSREADFFSVGTNDLSQYVLAMDRGNPALAADVDALHPAVLRLIEATAEAGGKNGKWVGVCGSAASDPIAAPLLIGLGVTELSVTPSRAPVIKAILRTLDINECRNAAREAVQLEGPREVRDFVLSKWPQLKNW